MTLDFEDLRRLLLDPEELDEALRQVHMSRETYRRLIVSLNPEPGNEPHSLYGMPVVFDERVPIDRFRVGYRPRTLFICTRCRNALQFCACPALPSIPNLLE